MVRPWREWAELIQRADVIRLADFDTAVPQDGVRRGDVEEEIRQRELEEIVYAGEFLRLAADRAHDLARLRAVDLLRFERSEVLDAAVDACHQFGETLLVVLVGGRIHPGEPRAGAARKVAGEP